MARAWEYVGVRPTGKWKLTITTPGAQDQIFYGATKADIADQLADAQDNASKRIQELRNPRQPQQTVPAGKPMTDAERFQVAADITDPAKTDKAVTRIIESVVGPVSELRTSITEGREQRGIERATAAATKFQTSTPDWYPSDFNKRTLTGYMKAQNMD